MESDEALPKKSRLMFSKIRRLLGAGVTKQEAAVICALKRFLVS
jgi:hypothetical protein